MVAPTWTAFLETPTRNRHRRCWPRTVVRSAHRSMTLRTTVDTERPQRGVVIRRVQHHLAPIALHCRPPIGKPMHLVRIGRFETADAERAARRRQVRPRLARPDDVHDRAQIWVDPLVAGN